MKKWLKRAWTALACLVMGTTVSFGAAACDMFSATSQSGVQSTESESTGESQAEHVHEYVETAVVEATCSTEGSKTLTCACGDEKTEKLEKLSHNFTKEDTDEKYLAAAANCESGASYYYSCTECGEKGTEAFTSGEKLEHVFENNADEKYLQEAATCTQLAIYKQSCNLCGEAGTETFSYGELAAHTWVETQEEQYLISAANCEQGTVYQKHCATCTDARGEYYTVGEGIGHDCLKTTIEATCFVDGYDSYTCQRNGCGHTYADLESVVKAPGKHSHEAVVTEPTCTTQGYTTYTCVCGDKYIADYTNAEHDYATVEEVPSTCSVMGYTLHTCACGDSYQDNFQPLAEHTFTTEVTKEASCTEEGVKTTTYTCACDKVYTDPIPKTGHVYTAGEPVAATCTDKGYTRYTCVCDDYYDVETAALGHTAGAWVLVTDSEGKESLTHVQGCTYVRTYVTSCLACTGEMTKTEELTKHNYVVSIARVATCQGDGLKAFTCVCGDNYTQPYALKEGEDGHQWGETVQGSGVETVYCQVKECGESKTTIVVKGEDAAVSKSDLAKTGEVQMEAALMQMDEATKSQLTSGTEDLKLHASTLSDEDKKDLINTVDPSLQKKLEGKPVYNFTVNNGAITQFDGMMTITVPYTLAEGEDAESIVVWYIDDEGNVKNIDATYTEINGTGYAVFSTDHFSKYTIVRLTPSERCAIYGHDEKERNVAPTCEVDGYHLIYCIRCGYNSEAEVYAAIGHNFAETVKEATCTTQGYTTYVCENGCGYQYKDNVVEALGHDYESVVTEATCKAIGYTTNTCLICSNSYKSDYTPKAAHEYEEEVKPATCYEKGYTRHTCVNCGSSYDDGFENKLEHKYEHKVVDPTCQGKGYTHYTCKNDGCKENYKSDYVSETGHKYGADFLCEVCKAEHPAVSHGSKGFYLSMRESVMNAESYYVTLENLTFTSTTTENGVVSETQSGTMKALKITFCFDEDGYLVGHGEFEMPMTLVEYEEGEETERAVEIYHMKVIFKDGKMYAFLGTDYANETDYEAYVYMSQDYMFGNLRVGGMGSALSALKECFVKMYSEDARKVITAAIGITDREVDRAIGAIIEYLFVKTETGEGYSFTFNADQLYNVAEKFATRSVKELIETFFGNGQFDKIFEKINGILDSTVGGYEAVLAERLLKAGYTIDDLYELVNYVGGMIFAESNSMDEFDFRDFVKENADKVIGEWIASETDCDLQDIKDGIAEIQEMLRTRSIVSVILELSGQAYDEEEAAEYIDELLEEVKKFLPYLGDTSITLTTDRTGKASALSFKLDIEFNGATHSGEHIGGTVIERKNTVEIKMDGKISFNDSYDMTFGDVLEKVEGYLGNLKFKDGDTWELWDDPCTVVTRGDDIFFVRQGFYTSIKDVHNKEFLGEETVNGVDYEKYSVQYSGIYQLSFDYWTMDETCGEWLSYYLETQRYAAHYTVWATANGTIVKYELDFEKSLEYPEWEESLSVWYNSTTGEMQQENVHQYVLLDSYETDVCEEESWYLYECSSCGRSYKETRRNYHNMRESSVLVEGATSCEDGWVWKYSCNKCDYGYTDSHVHTGHDRMWNTITVKTTCGSVRIEYSSCACGYERNSDISIYNKNGCQFEQYYGNTQFDEEGFPIPQDTCYKCVTCGDIITVKASKNNGDKYYDDVMGGKEETSCYTTGYFTVLYNDTKLIDKQYTVAHHYDYGYETEYEGEIRVEKRVCYSCGTVLELSKYNEQGLIYHVNEKGVGYRVEREGCIRRTYYFNASGDYNVEEYEDHGEYYYVFELRKEGGTCMDGLKMSAYCSGCNELMYKDSYRPEGHLLEASAPQELSIETDCGTVTVYYMACPCGAQGAIADLDMGACDMEMSGSDTEQAMICKACGFLAVMTRAVAKDGCTEQWTMVSTVSYGGKILWTATYVQESVEHSMEEIVETDDEGNRTVLYGCTVCGIVERSTTYDAYDRVIREVYESGRGYYRTFNGCYVTTSYFDSEGNVEKEYTEEEHAWGYTYKFMTDGKNCEDGVSRIYGCTVCGYEEYSEEYYHHVSMHSKNPYFTAKSSCGELQLYGENCPCDYVAVMNKGLWVNGACSFEESGEWLEDTETEFERYLRTYTCWNCGYTYTVYSYYTNVACKATYYVVYSFGDKGCDGTYTLTYTQERHENIRWEDGAKDDGTYLYERYCETCGTWFEHYEYKRDQYGRTVWYMDRLTGTGWERVYGDNCTYVEYTLDQAGTRISSVEGEDHAERRERYELMGDSITCEDGVYFIRYCPDCGKEFTRRAMTPQAYGKVGHPTYEHIEVFTVDCGEMYFCYNECACGQAVNYYGMQIYGACDTSWDGEEYLDSYFEHRISTYTCYVTECAFRYTVERYYYYNEESGCQATEVAIYTLYNGNTQLISKTGTTQMTRHRWNADETTDANGVRTVTQICSDCGIKIIEKYDSYGRQIYYWNDLEGYGWKRTFTGCEYVEIRFYRDGTRYEDGRGTSHIMVWNRYIRPSCTQYGTYISYCKVCGYKDWYEYVTPSHNYCWNEQLQTYVCSYCGLENDKGLDGNFIVEDLSSQYGEYTAGFFNKLGEMWQMENGYSFYIVLNYGTDNKVVEVGYDLLEYGYEYTGAAGSGIITLDMEQLNAAITKAYGANWAGFEHVSIVFQVFDRDFTTGQHSYVDHVLTFSRIDR